MKFPLKTDSILRPLSLIVLFVTIISFTFTGCGKASSGTTVRLNEVAHSIFYAPMYVAMEKGYFEEEGLNIELTTGFGADKTMTALLSGEADIGFMGPESTIYTYQQGNTDYVVNFAQLTQRAGNFLVSREKIDSFDWEMIRGKDLIGGRKGGMPQMILEYVLKLHGMDPEQDVNLVQNIDFANTSGAFIGGTGDFTVEFEPQASLIEEQGAGFVVASLGVESGYVPYTCFSAKKSYLEANPEIVQSFTNAIQKGMDFCAEHDAEEIAKVIAPQFPDTEEKLLVKIVDRYAAQDSFTEDAIFEKDSFMLLQSVLEEAGELMERVPYEDLVDNRFAETAMER
ncbi:MAG: ABC transporter substrate-binding protein [Lachnospiraceae bacterium]|nr:ABC transporter substrate-binding protein [Lachnospiraceae bacterium]